MDSSEEKLIKTVESLKDDILDFTCRLVGENSTLGNEASVIEVMSAELKRLSFSPVIVPIDPKKLQHYSGFAQVPWDYTGKNNVVAVRPPNDTGGKSIIFNGHLDVVDAEPLDFWDSDPFLPVTKEGRLYGRGTADMKSGVAAMTYAVHAIDRAGLGLKAPVIIEAVIEEECCGNGALACLDAGYTADGVLIPEPFGPTVLTNQLGVLWFKVSVVGKPVHVLEVSAGANAIEKMFPIVQALRDLEALMNEGDLPKAYQGIPHPINLNTGIFKGGNWPSTVPAKAELHGRLSFFPGVSYKSVCQKIADAVKKVEQTDPWLSVNHPQVEFYGFRSEGHSVPRNTPVIQTISDCQKALSGQDAREYIATCTTDLRAFYFYHNKNCTCYGPIGGNFHGANEWVDMESIIHTAKAYALFLKRWCELKE